MPPSNLVVAEASVVDKGQWESFLLVNADANYSHRWEWADLISRVYRLTTKRLVIRSERHWVAVFPVTLAPVRPGGPRKGVSLACCLYGDILVRPDYKELTTQLRRACLDELRCQGISNVQIRSRECTSAESPEMTFLFDLPGDEEQLWRQVGGKVRNQVRKAQQHGLSVHWGREYLNDFHRVYAANMGRLGTPAHARSFFVAHFDSFGPDAELLCIAHSGQVIAGMLLLRFRDTWINPIAASQPGMQYYNPNMLMYWEALSTANRLGLKRFDFGRSPRGSGTHHFKKQWGARPYPLHHQIYVDSEPMASDSAQFYRGRAGQIAAKLWSWLPDSIQRELGPRFRRWML